MQEQSCLVGGEVELHGASRSKVDAGRRVGGASGPVCARIASRAHPLYVGSRSGMTIPTTTSTADYPIIVRRSRIHGRGVFSTRTIDEGERIVEYTGARITHEQADAECADDEAMARHHTFFFAVDDKTVIDGGRGGNEAR